MFTSPTKKYKWAIRQWINWDCHLELGNIKTMLKSSFGIEASISYFYQVVSSFWFLWKKLGVSPYNRNSPKNIETWRKYAEVYIFLKAHENVWFFYIDESPFTLSLHNSYDYVENGIRNGVSHRASVCATT